jgi:hypothetical protein
VKGKLATAYSRHGIYGTEDKILCIQYYLENIFVIDQPGNLGLFGRAVMSTC